MTRDSLDNWIDKACEADPLPLEVEEPEREHGPPLTDSELHFAEDILSKWQTPLDFASATKSLHARCGSKDWFNDPHLKFLHDAYVLAEFVRLTKVESLRLANRSEQWPDGFVKLSNKIHNIEVTGTHGDRKLGDEYRTVSAPTLDPVSNWVARAESIPMYLDKSISTKNKKKYSSPCWLVVYLNISEWGIRQRETEKVIFETKERYAKAFYAISVLWKGKIY
jgi:hypothetical protein